jgi:hypothetical protein
MRVEQFAIVNQVRFEKNCGNYFLGMLLDKNFANYKMTFIDHESECDTTATV